MAENSIFELVLSDFGDSIKKCITKDAIKAIAVSS